MYILNIYNMTPTDMNDLIKANSNWFLLNLHWCDLGMYTCVSFFKLADAQ